jgi:hypothetical protein
MHRKRKTIRPHKYQAVSEELVDPFQTLLLQENQLFLTSTQQLQIIANYNILLSDQEKQSRHQDK